MKKIFRKYLEKIAASPGGKSIFFRMLKEKDVKIYSRMGDVAFVYDPSEFIGRRIYDTGEFQRSEIEHVAEMAARGRSGGIMLEIGANIGTTTVYGALTGHFRKIIAIEADRRNFELLLANIRLNGLTDIVHPICCAASNQAGTTLLRRNVLHSGMSSIEPVDGHFRKDTVGTTEEVEMRRADDILSGLGVAASDISLVWMDVEGHEPKALQGMERILAHSPPLYFEFTPSRYSPDEIGWIESEVLQRYRTIRLFSDDWHDLPSNGIKALDPNQHMNLFSC